MFSLAKTLLSGHIFAYDQLGPEEFLVSDGNKCFWVKQTDKLEFAGITQEELNTFFDLDRDLGFLQEHPELKTHSEVRLVRQDLRQAILTFIITANNNQKRIKSLVDKLRSFGKEVSIKNHRCKVFPERVPDEETLRELGFGYRAKSLASTDQLLTNEFIEEIKDSDHDKARGLLMTLPGVGPKVADCILAYSEFASGYAFPVDVWVGRAIKRRHRFTRKAFTDKNIQSFARKKFGQDASYIQHYYFLEEQARK